MDTALSGNQQLDDLIHDAGEVAGYLWQKGWAERNAGNISIDVTTLLSPDIAGDNTEPCHRLASRYPALAGRCYFITGTGKRMRDLPISPGQHATMIRVADDGNISRRPEVQQIAGV